MEVEEEVREGEECEGMRRRDDRSDGEIEGGWKEESNLGKLLWF